MAKQPHGSTPEFGAFIAERTEHFVGRDWVLHKLDGWLADIAGSRSFLLAGAPGSGKSAIAARLVQVSEGQIALGPPAGLRRGFLHYHHFCQGGLDSTLSPIGFVRALSETLANRYPAFHAALAKEDSRHIHIDVDQRIGTVEAGANIIGVQLRLELKGGDARSLFDEAVRRPLATFCSQVPDERVVLLIDSLDEALSFHADNNIVQLLRLTNDFPSQVRFVLTCRSKSDRVFDLLGEPSLDLIGDAPPGLDEVSQYAFLRLQAAPEPGRSEMAGRVAAKSQGNFLYAFHVLNDLQRDGLATENLDDNELPEELEDIYRRFLQRELAASDERWRGIYRPLLGLIAVAHGEGLTKAHLIGITDLAEDTASDVLKVCEQYLTGGEDPQGSWRIYHQSFRDFLLQDEKYNIYPVERHADVAMHFQAVHGSNWAACTDDYALRYTPVHWAEAAVAASSESKRAARTQVLVGLVREPRYQRQFEQRVGDLPQLQQLLLRATQVAAGNTGAEMLVWIIRAAKACVRFRRDFLEAESLLVLAEKGELDQALARLTMFVDLSEDWQTAARLILGWLAIETARPAAQALHERVARAAAPSQQLLLLQQRLQAALAGRPDFASPAPQPVELADGQERVKRMSGQSFNREMLTAINPSLMINHGELIDGSGYASTIDAPMLVHAARVVGQERAGSALVDEYIGAHSGYNYVEYRNQSLWLVLDAVLRNHPGQEWVRQRLRLILSVALSGGGVDFEESLGFAAAALGASSLEGDAGAFLDPWRQRALEMANQLRHQRGANDSWGVHKRRLIAMMELYGLVAGDEAMAVQLLAAIHELPGGFAGFQAPAHLRLADAVRAVGLDTPALLDELLRDALVAAHHIQDYHFCARVTSRCNTLARWHGTELRGVALSDAVKRLAASPGGEEFAADHRVREPYAHRDQQDPETLSVAPAQDACTLEQLVEVFQRPALEFLRVNPTLTMSEVLAPHELVRVPDPGLPALLATHLAARVLADESLGSERAGLVRSLVPLAVNNATALDTLLAYLLIASQVADAGLLGEFAKEAGKPEFHSRVDPSGQIGPDAIPA